MAKVPGVTSEILKKKVLEALEGIGIRAHDIMGRGTNVQRITSGRDINPFKPNMLQAMRGENKTMGDALDLFANEAKYIMNANDGELVNFLNNLNTYKSIGGGGVDQQGVGSMMKAMTDLEESAKNLKTSADEAKTEAEKQMKDALLAAQHGGPFKVPNEKFLGGSMHEEGQLRTGIRQFLTTELDSGRLKLDGKDTHRVRNYYPTIEDDVILVFKRIYGDDAYNKAGTFPGAFEKGEDFKHYEKIFRENMGDDFLKPLNKENVGDGTLVLDESFEYKKPPPEDPDIPFNQGGRVGMWKGSGKKIIQEGLESLMKKTDDVNINIDPDRPSYRGDWPGMEQYYKEEVGPSTDKAIERALKDFENYRHIVENKKGRGNRQSRKKRRSREIKTFKDWIDKLGVGQYFYKDGGRVGMVKGSGKKGVGSLIKLVDDKFGEGTLKTADDITRPEAAIADEETRKLFKDFNMKLTTEDLMKAAEPKMAGPIKTENKGFWDPVSTDHTTWLMQEKFFRPDAKDFLGQKVPSNWIAIEREKAKDTLKKLGPLPSKRHPNWEDMRQIRQGVKNRLVALDITEELGGNVAMFDYLRQVRGSPEKFLNIDDYIRKADSPIVKDELSGVKKAFVQKKTKPQIDWEDPRDKAALNNAQVKGIALSDAAKKMGYDMSKQKDFFAWEEAIAGGMDGWPKEIKEQVIRAKYGDLVDQRLLDNMLADDDPYRLAEVMATVEQGLKMQEIGMGPDEIVDAIKADIKRKPNAAGGGVGSMFREV